MSNLTQFSSGAIKGIQRGVITISGGASSNTATITSVDTTKTELRFLGTTYTGTTLPEPFTQIVLTNATTVTASRVVGAANTTTVSWELTEFY